MGIEAEGLEILHDYCSNSWPVWLSSPASPPSFFTVSHDKKVAVNKTVPSRTKIWSVKFIIAIL